MVGASCQARAIRLRRTSRAIRAANSSSFPVSRDIVATIGRGDGLSTTTGNPRRRRYGLKSFDGSYARLEKTTVVRPGGNDRRAATAQRSAGAATVARWARLR